VVGAPGAPVVAVLLARGVGAPAPDVEEVAAAARRVIRAQAAPGIRFVDDFAGWALAAPAPGPAAADVAVLGEVAERLADARRARAALDEGSAIRMLAGARRLLEARPALPGLSVWLAEVETQLGLSALQRGDRALGEAALRRAATLDPRRGVRAAEAPPDVVAAAEARARALAEGAQATVVVRAVPELADGRLWVDGTDRGPLPSAIEVPSGRHHLRVTARGHQPWGTLVDLPPGERPDLVVRLVPSVAAAAAAAADRGAPLDALARAVDGVAIERWELQVGPDRRALLRRCAPAGCGASLRWLIDGAPPASVPPWPPPAGASPTPMARRDDLAWVLGEDAAAGRRRRRIVAGTTAALVAVGLAVALGVILGGSQDDDPQQRLVIDPSGL